MMRSIFGIFLVLLTAMPHGFAQLNSYSRAELAFDNALTGYNPGFESGTVKWTASGGLFTINNTAADQFITGSKQFAIWDSNSAGQEVCSSLVKVPESGNCAVSLTYKVPSGTATHKIVAKDGSKDLSVEDVVSSTAAWRHDVEFPCAAAASNQARVCLRSVASNEPAIQLDGGYAGEARNVGVADYIGRVESYTPSLLTSGGGSITLNATSQVAINGKKQRIGSNLFISASFRNGSGGAASGSAGTMLITIPSECVPDTSQMVTSVSGVRKLGDSISGTTGAVTEGTAFYHSGQNLAFLSNGAPNALTVANVASSFFFNFNAIIPCVGWTASQVVTPEQQGWFASGEISGGGTNISLGVVDVTSYTEITNATLTLTPDSGSAAMGIMCSGTNAAATPSSSATTCSAGSESVGAAVNIPRSGRYEACFDFSHNVQIDSTEVVYSTFNVIQTPTNAQTLTQEGGPRLISGMAAPTLSGGTLSQAHPIRACGQLNLSAGLVGIRLMYEQAVANNPNVSQIYADQAAGFGQRSMRFSIRQITAQQQAILANSVSTKYQSGVTEETAIVTCSSSSGIDRQLGTWVSSVGNISSGACSVTVNGFSGTPYCDVNGWGTGISNVIVRAYCSSSTACEVSGYNTATGLAATGFTAKFSCKAQR